MRKDYINIAVWGIGNHAKKNLLPAINASKRTNLYGVSTRNKNTLDQMSEQYKCLTWSDYEVMLDDPNIDVVFLSTPPALHFNQGMKILRSGKHFFCEKPLTNNIELTIKLLDYAEKNDLVICEALMYQYHPHLFKLKNLMNSHEVGNIKSVSSSFGLPFLNKPGYRFQKELGASCLFDVGIYPISLIQSLFGYESIDVIYADKVLNQAQEFDLSGSAHLLIDSKINCFLEWSYNTAYRNDVDIQGENISLYTSKIFSKDKEYTPIIEIKGANGNITKKKISADDHFSLMIDYFAEIIDNKDKMKEMNIKTLHLSKLLNTIEKK